MMSLFMIDPCRQSPGLLFRFGKAFRCDEAEPLGREAHIHRVKRHGRFLGLKHAFIWRPHVKGICPFLPCGQSGMDGIEPPDEPACVSLLASFRLNSGITRHRPGPQRLAVTP
jgi:hypothetical protein